MHCASRATETADWEASGSEVSVLRCAIFTAALLVLIAATVLPGVSQSDPDLQTYFQQDIGLSSDQIAAIRNGHPGHEGAAVPHTGRGFLVWRDLHPCCS